MLKIKDKWLILIFFISLSIRLFLSNISPNSWDASEYSYYVRDLFFGSFTHLIETFKHNKAMFLLSGLFVNFFGAGYHKSLTIVSSIFGSLSIVPVYYLSKKMFGKGYFLTMLFSFSPLLLWYSGEAMTEICGLFFFMVACYFLYSWSFTLNIRDCYLAFFILGVGMLFRFSLVINIFMFLSFMVFILFRNRIYSIYYLFNLLFFILPISLYIFIVTFVLNLRLDLLSYFVSETSQGLFSLSLIFRPEAWIGNLYFLINGYTLPIFIFGILGFFLMLKNYKKDMGLFVFLGLWFFSNLIFYSGLPALLSRYYVLFGAVLIFYSFYFIYNYNFSRLWDIFVLFICSIFLLLNYLDMYQVYYISPLNAIFGVFNNLDVYYFISILLLFFTLVFSLRFKHNSSLTIIFLVLVTSVLYAMPILHLFGENSYVKNIGEFYGNNLDEGDLIIAGYDKPYDILYAPQAEVIFYRDEGAGTVNSKYDILEIVDNKLFGGSSVYFSSEHFLTDLYDDLALHYDIDLVGVVYGRGVHDWGSAFMNYQSYKHSEEVFIYSLNFKS